MFKWMMEITRIEKIWNENIRGWTGVANIRGWTGVANIRGWTGVANIRGWTGVANIRGWTGVANISEKTREARLRWFGYVKRMTDEDVVMRTWKRVDTER